MTELLHLSKTLKHFYFSIFLYNYLITFAACAETAEQHIPVLLESESLHKAANNRDIYKAFTNYNKLKDVSSKEEVSGLKDTHIVNQIIESEPNGLLDNSEVHQSEVQDFNAKEMPHEIHDGSNNGMLHPLTEAKMDDGDELEEGLEDLSVRKIFGNIMSSEMSSSGSAEDNKTSLQINGTEIVEANMTQNNSTGLNNSNSKQSNCITVEERGYIEDVQIVNATTLQKILISDLNITSRSVPAKCNLIYFFSLYCPFSAQGSAYVNALARSLKNIPVYGLDSIEHHSMNARYGVMGTPSLILFHNGNVVARYNASEYSTFHLESFIHHFTNQVIESINVTSHDFKTNLPSKVLPSTPFALYCAWVFLLTLGGWLFLSSEFYAKLTEAVLNNWREAEAQHAHDD